MIPLIIFQDKDKLLKETTATVTKMRAHYRHLKRAIEIEYEINLGMNFSLMIELNEFDEPKYVYIKTLKNSSYQEVKEDKVYIVSSDREVVMLTYDHILKIAHNTITYDEVKEIEIRAKMINTQKDPDIKMTSFKIDENLITFSVNGVLFEYSMADFMPQLVVNLEHIEPVQIYDNYYIYPVKLNGKEYYLAIIHFNAFKHHYLFRAKRTKALSLEANTLYDYFNNSYYFRDGLVVFNDYTMSLQKFLEDIYENEYKQYFLNAIRDKNLYTEIALAFNITKHHSFNVYDFSSDERLMGKVEAKIEYNSKLTPELVIRLKEPFNQFLQKRNDTFEFRMPVFNLYKLLSHKNQNYRLIDYGYFLVNKELSPVTPMIINSESANYVSASSSKYFFSIAIDFLERILENIPLNLVAMIRAVDKNVYLPSHIYVKRIDFLKKEIELNNVFESEVYSFDELDKSPLIVKDNTLFNSDNFEMFSMQLAIKPSLIEFSPVTPDNYDEVALLIKYAEDDDYLIEDIEKDTKNFSRAMKMQIASREFLFVLNEAKDKIYFLDLTNHTSSQDLTSSMKLYIKSVDMDKLKTLLKEFALYSYIVKDRGYSVNVDKELNVIPFVVYSGIESINSLNVTKTNVGSMSLNSQLRALYKKSTNVYKEYFRGIYANNQASIEKIYLKDNRLYIEAKAHNKLKTFKISLSKDGAFRCFNLFSEVKFLDYDKKYSDISYGPISFFEEFAIDLEIVKKYLSSNDLAINSYAYAFRDKSIIYKGSFTELSYQEPQEIENVYAMREVFWGDEFFGIISLDELEHKDLGDVYFKCPKDDRAILVPFDFAKYIVKV